MATNLDFGATVGAWAHESEDRLTRIWKASTQEVHSIITDNLSGEVVNAVTGFLRASDRASTDVMPPIDPNGRPKAGASYTQDLGQISAVISGAQLGQTIYVGWTAAYGPYLEFGTEHIAARGFVRLAAAQWQHVVSEQVAEAKSRVG